MSLKINEPGLLNKTGKGIDAFFIESLQQLTKYTSQQLRMKQYEQYEKFVLAKTGINIKTSPALDPFIPVTSFPLKRFVLERFKKNIKHPCVMSATTDLITNSYLSNMKLRIMDKGTGEREYKRTYRLPNNAVVNSRFRLIGSPIVMKEKLWEFSYAAIDHTFGDPLNKDLYFLQGLLFIEEEPLQLLRNTPQFQDLYELLLLIANEFGHDLVGHGSLDFGGGELPEANAYMFTMNANMSEHERMLSDLCSLLLQNSRVAMNFNEFRQLNLYMRFIEACIDARNEFLLEIIANLHLFFDLLKKATMTITAIDQREPVYLFFGQVYFFCLFRMLSAHRLTLACNQEELSVLRIFAENNSNEALLNVFSSNGSGMPVPKKGLGGDAISCSPDDVTYLDHRVIFQDADKRIQKSAL